MTRSASPLWRLIQINATNINRGYASHMVRDQLVSPVYTIMPLKDGRYAVKAAVAGSAMAQYHEFLSKADADEWIDRHRRELGLKPAPARH
ncbi:MAG TPA: hypothetical protein VNG52_01115 [Stellaceae bacterium]|nr:hypothetical protein [Stellaceae bacterium]